MAKIDASDENAMAATPGPGARRRAQGGTDLPRWASGGEITDGRYLCGCERRLSAVLVP